jgi:regulator of replication initiation timing
VNERACATPIRELNEGIGAYLREHAGHEGFEISPRGASCAKCCCSQNWGFGRIPTPTAENAGGHVCEPPHDYALLKAHSEELTRVLSTLAAKDEEIGRLRDEVDEKCDLLHKQSLAQGQLHGQLMAARQEAYEAAQRNGALAAENESLRQKVDVDALADEIVASVVDTPLSAALEERAAVATILRTALSVDKGVEGL